MTIWVAKPDYWTAINMTREQVTGLVTAQKKSSSKNHGLGGKSTNSVCRVFATLRATKVSKITVIFRRNTVSGSTVSSLPTGLSCTHIPPRIEILLGWQNIINVSVFVNLTNRTRCYKNRHIIAVIQLLLYICRSRCNIRYSYHHPQEPGCLGILV